ACPPRRQGALRVGPADGRRHPGRPPCSARERKPYHARRRTGAGAFPRGAESFYRAEGLLTSPRPFAGRGRRASSDARRVRGKALNQIRARILGFAPAVRFDSFNCWKRSASPLTRSLRSASAPTSPRAERGEVEDAHAG